MDPWSPLLQEQHMPTGRPSRGIHATASRFLGETQGMDASARDQRLRSRASMELETFRMHHSLEGANRKAFCQYKSNQPQPQAQGYEGLDYWEPFNTERRKHITEHHHKGRSRAMQWLLFALIGAMVALISISMKQSVERVVIFRFRTIHSLLGADTSDGHGGHSSGGSTPAHGTPATPDHGVTPPAPHPTDSPGVAAFTPTPGNSTEGDPPGSMTKGSFGAGVFWVMSSTLFVLASCALVIFVEPKAAGSGLPEVMAYLNGVQLNRVFSLKVMATKFFSCLFAVSSGLPVGPEGPMIHLGSMVGAFLTQKKHRWLFPTKLGRFRNTMDRRAFITCGAAAGVSAAFGAPVGGLLFVMEEIASYWDRSLTWMIFFATMVAFFVVVIFNSVLHGWEPTGYAFGSLVEEAVVLFQPEIVLTKVNLNLLIIFPSAVIGVVCGFIAVLFTRLNLTVVKWRRRVINRERWLRVAEPVMIAVVYSTVCYVLPLMSSCNALPTSSIFNGEVVPINQNDFAQFTCTNDNEYSPLATLMLNSGENSVRHLFSKGTRGQFHSGALLVYLLVYFFFAALSAGSAFATGIVIPMLVIGSTLGRLLGEFFQDVVPTFNDFNWFDPGLFALIGSAAFFAGVSRLTLSLAVIMIEISHEIYFLPPMMIAIMCAKWTADYKEPHSLYHALIHLMDVPFLDGGVEAAMNYELFTAEDVMSCPVVTLRESEDLISIFEALSTTHSGFPVVNGKGQLKGLVLRVQLEAILDRVVPHETDGEYASLSGSPGTLRRGHQDFNGLMREVREFQTEEAVDVNAARIKRASLFRRQQSMTGCLSGMRLDLSVVMSTSPFVVHKNFRFNLTRIVFQAMSMRHLVVVTTSYRVAGIITRKNIIKMDQDIAAFRALYDGNSDAEFSDGEAAYIAMSGIERHMTRESPTTPGSPVGSSSPSPPGARAFPQAGARGGGGDGGDTGGAPPASRQIDLGCRKVSSTASESQSLSASGVEEDEGDAGRGSPAGSAAAAQQQQNPQPKGVPLPSAVKRYHPPGGVPALAPLVSAVDLQGGGVQHAHGHPLVGQQQQHQHQQPHAMPPLPFTPTGGRGGGHVALGGVPGVYTRGPLSPFPSPMPLGMVQGPPAGLSPGGAAGAGLYRVPPPALAGLRGGVPVPGVQNPHQAFVAPPVLL